MADEEIRAVMRNMFLKGLSPSEAKVELDRVYPDQAPKYETIKWWFRQFKLGRTELKNIPKPGAPNEIDYGRLASKVEKAIKDDRRTSYRELSDSLGVSKDTISKVLKGQLGLKKLSPKSCPKELTDAEKRARIEASQATLRKYNLQPNAFLRYLFTMDETPIPLYDPLTRTEGSEWVRDESELSRQPTTSLSVKKVQASVYWDAEGIIKIFWLDEGETVNGDVYRQQLVEVNEIVRKRHAGSHRKPLFLQDNARPHKAKATMALIDELGWSVINHPPYSPDLAPSDFWLFAGLKRYTRGRRFKSITEVKAEVESFFEHQPASWYAAGLAKLPERYQKCIDASGDYFN